ncbi:unnamed protein product, partial [Rangifer tarandus platyrhynchus]
MQAGNQTDTPSYYVTSRSAFRRNASQKSDKCAQRPVLTSKLLLNRSFAFRRGAGGKSDKYARISTPLHTGDLCLRLSYYLTSRFASRRNASGKSDKYDRIRRPVHTKLLKPPVEMHDYVIYSFSSDRSSTRDSGTSETYQFALGRGVHHPKGPASADLLADLHNCSRSFHTPLRRSVSRTRETYLSALGRVHHYMRMHNTYAFVGVNIVDSTHIRNLSIRPRKKHIYTHEGLASTTTGGVVFTNMRTYRTYAFVSVNIVSSRYVRMNESDCRSSSSRTAVPTASRLLQDGLFRQQT